MITAPAGAKTTVGALAPSFGCGRGRVQRQMSSTAPDLSPYAEEVLQVVAGHPEGVSVDDIVQRLNAPTYHVVYRAAEELAGAELVVRTPTDDGYLPTDAGVERGRALRRRALRAGGGAARPARLTALAEAEGGALADSDWAYLTASAPYQHVDGEGVLLPVDEDGLADLESAECSEVLIALYADALELDAAYLLVTR